jgi:hypothetical protein
MSDLVDSQGSKVDFSLRVETETNMLGPKVKVVATQMNGEVVEEWMDAFLAVDFVLRNPALGVTIKSAHIKFSGVYDEWGQSF